ncbi:MAG: aminodeoxychorismate lyase [Candidatus Parcubacteria bacterium]|nr:MAG: aminodeoxychorismate lyase [Candidatus Parcubacteria bacterium]
MAHEDLMKKIFKLYPFIVIFVFIILISLHFVYSVFVPLLIGERKEIYINPGTKIWFLAQNLEKNGIIRSAFYFRFLVNLRNSKIKAGIYEFSGYYNLLDVIQTLEKGGRGVKITIIEGLTLKEIEKLLKEKGFNVDLAKYKLADFSEIDLKNYFPAESSLEGFLAPDTYEFFPNDDEKTIVQKILKNFSRKYLPEILKGMDFNLYQRLILASIVEKEAKYQDDFPIIAGILIKRLKNNKQLEVDAALVYEKCGFVFCQDALNKKDLIKDSPYNTYKKLGLTPTPISNPGILAIKSVNNPVQTDYWYYLTDSEGRAIFAKTFKEHQENIKKYLKR